jgi:signal recognition particle receptor subunit beta
MLIDWSKRVIQTKVVYYGPAMSGKTASIRALFRRLNILSRLESIETSTGRTLFFDYGPIEIVHSEWALQIHIWSATGQDYYAETRSTVLAGTDGIVFVADSNPQLLEDNKRCWDELQTYFGDRLLSDIPVVFALNKRDITPKIEPRELVAALHLNGGCTLLETIATEGVQTLNVLLEVLRKILLGADLAQPKEIGMW